MNKFKKIIKYDKKIMTLLTVIALIGIVTGSIFVVILNKNDKSLVVNSIKDFFNNIINSKFDYIATLKNTLFVNLIFSFFIWIIGISVIGIIITILIIFYKTFILGFTIASIIYTYSLKGSILALLYIFPHLIINIFIFLYLGSYSIKLSMILINAILKKQNLNFKEFINSYLKVLLISFIFLIISSLYETFISTFVLKFITNIFI